MSKISNIKELYPDEVFLDYEGFDDAILGVAENLNEPMRLIYSVDKCLTILEQWMEQVDTIEYFMYNMEGAFVGSRAPIWCWDLPEL